MLGFLLGELKEVFVNGNTRDITQKFKIAAVKPEIHVSTFVHGISRFLYIIATKLRCYTHVFWG